MWKLHGIYDRVLRDHCWRSLNTRVLWFFMKGRRIVAVHGVRNKSQAISARDLDTAWERMRDWQKRYKA